MRRRLGRLEEFGGREPGRSRSPEDVYDRIRRDAAESIEWSRGIGEEPLYRITGNGDVETADGRLIENTGGFVRAIDEHIAELEAEIAEEEAGMSPEEVERRRAEHEASMARLEGLSLGEAIAALEAEIAEAEIEEEEPCYGKENER